MVRDTDVDIIDLPQLVIINLFFTENILKINHLYSLSSQIKAIPLKMFHSKWRL